MNQLELKNYPLNLNPRSMIVDYYSQAKLTYENVISSQVKVRQILKNLGDRQSFNQNYFQPTQLQKYPQLKDKQEYINFANNTIDDMVKTIIKERIFDSEIDKKYNTKMEEIIKIFKNQIKPGYDIVIAKSSGAMPEFLSILKTYLPPL